MGEIDPRQELLEGVASDRVAESVRRALQLVGPAEGGAERIWTEEHEEEPAGSR
jgi:hypothetical protein